jgi:hypothetical protein
MSIVIEFRFIFGLLKKEGRKKPAEIPEVMINLVKHG